MHIFRSQKETYLDIFETGFEIKRELFVCLLHYPMYEK